MLKRLIIFLLFVQISYGQTKEGIEICLKVQEYVNSFITDKEAENALDKILSVIGASKNFRLQSCDNINNAIAVTFKGNRYILYDKKFMQLITDYTNNWSNLFILAHEVGHHINGHTRDAALSAILDDTSLAKQRQEELEADKFAGFVLAKLGASLNQTIAAIDLMTTNSDDRYSTHPNKNKRIEAIRIGFNNGLPKINTGASYSNSSTSDSYFSWQKNVENSGNPFGNNVSLAYTFGEIKPANNSNINLKPKLTIEKNDNDYFLKLQSIGEYEVDFYKTALEYKSGKYEYIVERGLKYQIKINNKKKLNPYKSDGYYFELDEIKKLVWERLNINKNRKPDAVVDITLEILANKNKYNLEFKNVTPQMQRIRVNSHSGSTETISFLDGKVYMNKELVIRINNIKSDNAFDDFDSFINDLKTGNNLYIRIKNYSATEYFNLNDYGIELLNTYDDSLQNFRTKLFWDINIPSQQYFEFSLKGSSKALDFIPNAFQRRGLNY